MKYATKLTTVMVLVFSLFLMTCDIIGLGGSVDIAAPVVTISYPPSASIIRNTFIMSGTVEEETKLDSVVVSYKDENGITQTINAEVKKDKKWQAEINLATDGIFEMADGRYDFTVTATDSSAKTGSASITYTIDNTSPVLVITQPSTVDAAKQWEFGAQIEFAGMQYDENAGDLFEINFFDKDRKFVAKTEFTTPIQNFTFATGTGVFDELREYATAFPQIYWYSIAVYDNAFEYKNPGELKANGKVDNSAKKGNHSNHYYSWTQITSLLQINDAQPKVSALYELELGKTLSSDEMPSSITYEKLTEIQLPYASDTIALPENATEKKLGVFSIDPENVNPSISIDGLYPDALATGNQIALNATLRVEIKKALDGKFDINMPAAHYRLDSYSDETGWKEGSWEAINDYIAGSSVIWNLAGPNTIGKYRLVFDVKDYNGKEPEEEEREWEIYVNSGAPSVTLSPGTSINSKIYAKDNKMDISIVAEDDSDTLQLFIYEMDKNFNYTDESGNPIPIAETFSKKATVVKGSDGRYKSTWKLSLNAPNDGDTRGFYIVVDDGRFKEALSRLYTVDTTSPELKELTSPSRVTGKDYALNESNIVTIKGYADEDLEKAWFTYTKDNAVPARSVIWTEGSVDDSKQEREINGEKMFVKGFNANVTLPFTDGKAEEGIYYLWYRFADDTYDEVTESYGDTLPLGTVFVDSSAPLLTDSVGTETIQYTNKEVVLSGTVSDGNGIKDFILEERVDNADYEVKDITYDAITGNWSYTIPYNADHSFDGAYSYRIKAIDNAEKTTTLERHFVIDTISPDYYFGGIDSTVLDTDDTYFVNGVITINGSVDGENLSAATYKIAGSSNAKNLGSSWKIEFDTTQFEDGKKLSEVLFFEARDNAGNAFDYNGENELKLSLEKYIINQDSDKPNINLTQSVDVSINNEENIKVGTNLFGAGVDKFYGSITDDDGIKSVQYVFAAADKTITESDFIAYEVVKNAKTVAFNLNLAEKTGETYLYNEGLYKAQFVVVDKNGLKQQTDEFLFAIDRSSPTITNDSASGEYKTTDFVITGSVSDASGEVTLTRSVSSVDGAEAAGKSELNVENNIWSDSISNAQTGTHVIDYTATDKYGRETTIKFTFMVDDKAPRLTVTEPASKSIFIDESASYRVEGTAEDEGPSGLKGIYYYISQGEAVSAPGFDINTWLPANGLAHWTALIDFTGKTEENYTIHFATSDNAGNTVVAQTGISVNIDTQKPLININEVNSLYKTFHKDNFALSGKASDDRGIQSLSAVLISGETETPLSNTGTVTDWNFAIPVETCADGAYTVKITAKDSYNRETVANYSFSIDKTAPVVEIAVPGNGEYITSNRKTMKGSFIEEGSGVKSLQYSLQKENEAENWKSIDFIGTSWNLLDLLIGAEGSEGNYELKLKVTDNLGYEGNASVKFIKDLYKPTVTFAETTRLVTNNRFVLAGTASDSNELKTVEITATVDGQIKKWIPTVTNENWTQEFEVSEGNSANYIPNGTYEFTVVATDVIGQTTQVNRSVVVDTSSPAVDVDTNEVLLFTDENADYRLEGTAQDIGDSGLKAVYYLLSEGKVTATPSLIDVNTWKVTKGLENWNTTLSFADKSEKVYTIFVGTVDTAGNSYIVPNGIVVTLDKQKPVLIATPLNAVYFAENFALSGKAADDTAIASVSGVLISGETEIPLSNTGTVTDWNFTIPVESYADGAYTVKITAKDSYNRETVANYSFAIDKTAPVVEIVVPSEDEHISLNRKTLRGNLNEEGSGIKSLKYKLYTGNEPEAWITIADNTKTSWSLKDLLIGTEGSEGEYTLKLEVIDNLGLKGESSVSFVKDLNAPELTTETSDLIVGNGFTLSGIAADSNLLKEVVLKTKINATEKLWTLAASSNDFDWSKEFSTSSSDIENYLPSGTYTFDIIAYDSVGQTAQARRKVIVDTTSPTISALEFKNTGYVTINEKKWNRTGSLGFTVNASDNEGGSGIKEVAYAIVPKELLPKDASIDTFNWETATWVPCVYKDSTYSATLSFEENGENYLNIRSIDNAGNTTYRNTYETICVDTTSPSVEFNSVTINGTESTDTQVLLNGEHDVVVKVKADGEDASSSGIDSIKLSLGNKSNAAFTTSLLEASLVEGEENIYSCKISKDDVENGIIVYAQITDKVGNKSGAVTLFQIEKDDTDPVVAITSHSNGSKVNGTIALAGTTTESQGLKNLQVYVNAELKGTFLGNEGFNWSYALDTTDYTDGSDLAIDVTATDNAGNSGTTTLNLAVNQDSDRPVITLNNVSMGGYLTGQKTIYGSVADDDGSITSLKISKDSGASWIPVTVANGGFDFTLNESDGEKTLYFGVTDSSGTEFTTGESKQPLLTYTKDGNKIISEEPLAFKLDTNPPDVDGEKTKLIFNAAEEIFANNLKVGGNRKDFVVRVAANDGNGIKSVELTVGDIENPFKGIKNGTEDDNELWDITVDSSAIGDGSVSFELTVTDNAGSSATLTKTLLVDNIEPGITVESHTKNEQITGIVRLAGSTSDDFNGISGSGVQSIHWLIAPNSDIFEDGTTTLKSDDAIIALDSWQSVSGTTSWSINFSGTSELSTYVKPGTSHNPDDDILYGTEINDSNIWELPIFLLIEDNVGNKHLEKFSFKVDPDGDKPKANITYPTDEQKLGGTIRTFGTADDNVAVSAVYMQISLDGNFDNSDKTTLAGYTYTENEVTKNVYQIEEYTLAKDSSSTDWGIKVKGSTSWNMSINVKGEFNPPQNSTRDIYIRVRALDNNGLAGVWSDAIKITIDNSAPRIGSNDPLRLVQYANNITATGDEIASMDYVQDMWIKGDWWLVGSVQDESGIFAIDIETQEDSDVNLDSVEIKKTAVSAGGFTVANDSGYRFKIPLTTTNANGDVISFKLSATDIDPDSEDTSLTSTLPISVKFDNTAPDITAVLKHGDYDVSSEPITQSNNGYEITSSIEESGSGFSRLAIYFKRTGTGGTRIYNPLLVEYDEEGNKTDNTRTDLGNDVTITNGLPRLSVTGATRSGEDIISHDDLKGNPNIRKGGLVRIAGVERLITNVDSITGAVTFTPGVSTTYTTAEFAYALVVDNFKIENVKPDDYDDYGNPNYISNDDGDDVVESVEKSGAIYNWTLSINSKNIPDGPLDVCYVAFDEAGNASEIKTVSTSVQNNRPAIAKVWLGTDLNGDNSVAAGEEVEYRSNVSTKDAEYDVSLDTTKEGETLFTAKGNTTICPEIVGGNGNLYYYLNDTKKLLRGTDIENGATVTGDGRILLSVANEKLAGVSDGEKRAFSFKIWDSTEECTPGVSSQWASINVSMAVDVVDDVAPQVVINPLYWNSKTENSLYQTLSDEGAPNNDGTENGHIELGSELPATFKDRDASNNLVTGIMDRDDKVSGKITFTGTAYDNVRLNTLSFSFDQFNGSASFDKETNTWIVPSNTIANGWEFSVKYARENEDDTADIYLDQRGHKVNWTLSIDTSKINGTAAADVNLTVAGVDHTNKNTNKTTVSRRVDVVPYITSVQTSLSNINRRTPTAVTRSALGKYPVKDGETVTFTGFNLTVTSMTVSSSGQLNYTGAGTLLNNINNNDAKGSCTAALTQANYATYAYNRQPNNYNNNLLTDDIEFIVWQFDEDAVKPKSGKIEQPIMKINPANDEVGFAFVNGPLYFSMGGSVKENNKTTHYSHRYWMGSYDFFTSVGFTYDSLGYSYGVAAGGDINSTSADKFQLMSSRWGLADLGQSGSYGGTNSLRLESIGQKGDAAGNNTGTRYFDKQRIKSPSMATTVNGNSTNLYLAYYDAMNDEIRFKAGSASGTSKAPFGNFTDYDTNGDPYEYRNATVSMIAGSKTGRKAGEYISLGAIKGVGTNGSDVVVIVWYGSDRTLWYSYTTSSPMNRQGQTDGRGWSTPVAVFSGDMENTGEYCKVAVDNNGGIHIAAYDPVNLDLCYAYKNAYNATSFATCVVDSNGVTGSNLTLDVAKVGNNWIPYIGYYATYCIKPKYAYKVNTASMNPAGSVEDMVTGAWESMVVPTSSTIEMQSNQHNDINIAAWKDTNGALKASKSGTNSQPENVDGYSQKAYGHVYGNGTSNPIMGYAIKSGASQNTIETAQIK